MFRRRKMRRRKEMWELKKNLEGKGSRKGTM